MTNGTDDSPSRLANFLTPTSLDRFLSEYYDNVPLHVSADDAASDRQELMDSATVSALLRNTVHWPENGLKLVANGQSIASAHYHSLRELANGAQQVPNGDLIEGLMRMGATLIIDGLEDRVPHLRRLCEALGRQFAAKVGVNLYASQSGVAGFATHCDPHEVFAVQCEGEKVWRIYANRADRPVSGTILRDQQAIDRAKGPVAYEIRMQPGDLLYIPRGYYHDALAIGGSSLHLTFGVQPLYGLVIFDLLRDLARNDTRIRAYFPSANDGSRLEQHLDQIAEIVADLIRTPGLREDIAVKQRLLAGRGSAEPTSSSDRIFSRTGLPAHVEQPSSGSVLVLGGKREPAGFLSDAAHWALSQSSFTSFQLEARFAHHPRGEVNALLNLLLKHGAFVEQRPN